MAIRTQANIRVQKENIEFKASSRRHKTAHGCLTYILILLPHSQQGSIIFQKFFSHTVYFHTCQGDYAFLVSLIVDLSCLT